PVQWNYFKQQLSAVGTPTSVVSSFAINITTDATSAVTGSGILLDDVRVISDKNTTGGVWGEGSGVWTIYNTGVNKVYRQNSSCNLTIPQLMLKTTYRDFVYSAKITPVSAAGIRYSALVFKYKSSNGSYYMFNYNDAGAYELLKYTGATTTTVTSLTIAPLAAPYWLKVVNSGTSIMCYSSTNGTAWGAAVLTATDTAGTQGNIGIFSGSDSAGDKIAYFDEVKVLPVPENLTATNADNQVQLVFLSTAYSGEVSLYNIYRSTTPADPAPALIGTCSGTSYNDVTAVNGTKYYYKVTAVVVKGIGSEETDIALSNEVVGEPHPGVNITNNPFTPNSANPAFNKATFAVYNSANDRVEMYVYKPNGTLVAVVTPENSTFSWSASMSTFTWDGKTNSGKALEGGFYIWQIKVGGVVAGKGTIVLAK
ncbi:MAG: hypothetical protein WCI43_06220, partial [Candidatus Firestonebacteria bacterium]